MEYICTDSSGVDGSLKMRDAIVKAVINRIVENNEWIVYKKQAEGTFGYEVVTPTYSEF